MSVKNLVNRIQELSDKTIEELSKELGKEHVESDELHITGDTPWSSYYIYNDDGNVVGVFGFETSLKLASGDYAIFGYWDVADELEDFLYTKDYSSINSYYYEKFNAETNTTVDSTNVTRPKTTKSLTTFIKDMKKVFSKIIPENHDVLLNEDYSRTFNSTEECLNEFNSLVTNYTYTILDILGPKIEATTVVDTIDCKLTKCIHKESGITVGVRVDKGSVFTVNFEKGRGRLIFRLERSDNTIRVIKDTGFTFMKFLDFDTWCKELTNEVGSNTEVFLEATLNEDTDVYVEYDSNEEAEKALNELINNTEAKLSQVIPADMQKQTKQAKYDALEVTLTTYEKDDFKLTVVFASNQVGNSSNYQYQVHFNTLDNTRIIFSTSVQYNYLKKQLNFSSVEAKETLVAVAELATFIAKLQETIEEIELNKDIFLEGNLMEEIIDATNNIKEDFVYFHSNDFNEAKENYDQLVEEWDVKLDDVINKYNGKKVTSAQEVINGCTLETISIYFTEFPDFEVTLAKVTFSEWFGYAAAYSVFFKSTIDEKTIGFIAELTRQGDIFIGESSSETTRTKTFDDWLNLLCQTIEVSSPSTDTFLEDYILDDADERVVKCYNELKAGLSETLEKNDLFIKEVKELDTNKQIGTIRRIPLVVKEHLQYNVNDIKLNIALVQTNDQDDLEDYKIAMGSFMNDEEGVRYQIAILGENYRSSIVHLRSNDQDVKNVESFDILIENFIKYVKNANNNSDVVLESIPLKEDYIISLPAEIHNAYEDVTKIAKDIADLIQKYTKIIPVVETSEFAEADSSAYQKIEYTFNARYYSLNDDDKIVSREHAGTVVVSTFLGSIGPTQNWMGISILYLPWVGSTKNATLSTDMIEDITGQATLTDIYQNSNGEEEHLSFDALLDEIITSFGHVESADTFL